MFPSLGIPQTAVIGRFAPSPTGRLHLGSLTTAIASYCHIQSLSLSHSTPSQWLLRIEDVDTQRCQAIHSDAILQDLSNLGLHWDGEVIYQSQRTELYNSYLQDVLAPYVYACQCSRKDLRNFSLYPRHCLQQSLDHENYKLRIILPNHSTAFFDGIQGVQWQNPQTSLGDMVIRRDRNSQNMINYILAVSIDDGLQQVSHVMRGLDIVPMTSAQIAIMRLANLPAVAQWDHLPLVNNAQGQKLSKQNLAMPIDTSSTDKCSQLIHQALTLLQQPAVTLDTPDRMLAQAISQWTHKPLIHKQAL